MKRFRRTRDLSALTLFATDGHVGSVQQLYFDDRNWAVRYLLVHTGGWLSGRTVLIAPIAVEKIDDTNVSMQINLCKEQIAQAPTIEETWPRHRHYADTYETYVRCAPYWQLGSTVWERPAFYADSLMTRSNEPLDLESSEQSHLRSSREITGYGILARDGQLGHVGDLIVDDNDWVVRYIEVNTRNWLPGKKVLVQAGRIKQIDGTKRSMMMSLTKHAIQSAPACNATGMITPDYELQLFKHYGTEATQLPFD